MCLSAYLGIGLELACNGGSCGGGGNGGRLITFEFEKTPRISLRYKLVPVQYREYEHGLLLHSQLAPSNFFSDYSACLVLMKLTSRT